MRKLHRLEGPPISEQRDPETRLKYIHGIGRFHTEEVIIYIPTFYPPNRAGHFGSHNELKTFLKEHSYFHMFPF
jgi:hypothetical protein